MFVCLQSWAERVAMSMASRELAGRVNQLEVGVVHVHMCACVHIYVFVYPCCAGLSAGT